MERIELSIAEDTAVETMEDPEQAPTEEPVVEDAPEEAAPARRAAPRPKLSTEFVEPEGETERQIAALWADLLGIDRVGRTDDFFELGGNSLVMMQVNVRLRSMYGLSLPIRELFEIPEVRLLAERLCEP